jgi:hypothetical protein
MDAYYRYTTARLESFSGYHYFIINKSLFLRGFCSYRTVYATRVYFLDRRVMGNMKSARIMSREIRMILHVGQSKGQDWLLLFQPRTVFRLPSRTRVAQAFPPNSCFCKDRHQVLDNFLPHICYDSAVHHKSSCKPYLPPP